MSVQSQRHSAPAMLSFLTPLISAAGMLLSAAVLTATRTVITPQQRTNAKNYAPGKLSSLVHRIYAPQRWQQNVSGIPSSLNLDAAECHFSVLPDSYTFYDDYVSLQQNIINGVHYAIHAYEDGRRELHVRFPLQVTDRGHYAITGLPADERNIVGTGQVHRFDFLRTSTGAAVSLTGCIDPVNAVLHFSMPVEEYEIGKVDGTLRLSARAHVVQHFTGYVYAVPDRHELVAFAATAGN